MSMKKDLKDKSEKIISLSRNAQKVVGKLIICKISRQKVWFSEKLHQFETILITKLILKHD